MTPLTGTLTGQRWDEDHPEIMKRLKFRWSIQHRAQTFRLHNEPNEKHGSHDQHDRRCPILEFLHRFHSTTNDDHMNR